MGINVFGYIDGEFGLGEAVRLLIKAIKNANIPVALINYDVNTNHRHDDKTFVEISTEAVYSINLVLLGPTETKKILTHFGADFFINKYNIYYLNWESEYFPDEYVDNISYFDEIWVPAKYCKDVISKKIQLPVNIVPYPIKIDVLNSNDDIADKFYDKSKFNFFFMFDYNSTLERKNPLNLITAFEKAFGKHDKTVCLTIKTSKSNKFVSEKKLLIERISGFENINIVEEIFEKDTLHKIIKNCDCYVSLHRSEGFGLTMAEAMYYGKPVIATGYSGNLEFMNTKNSFLVDYEICKIGSDNLNYDKNTIWSNPNVDHASELMKLVKDNNKNVQEIAKNGNETIVKEFSLEIIGNLIKNRLTNIFSNYSENKIKNNLILMYIENESLKAQLYIVNKSKLIKLILDIKLFFRNRKNKRREKRKNNL